VIIKGKQVTTDMFNALTIICGLFIGSLLNLCIDRIPLRKSVFPLIPSCTSCGNPLQLSARIPVFGYLLARGKCGQCNALVSMRYPVIELAAASIFIFFYRKFGLSLEFITHVIFFMMLLLISVIDLKDRSVPDILPIGGLVIGLILAFFRKPLFFTQDALYGIFIPGGIILIITYCGQKLFDKEVFGYGDIELLCMIGAFCGLRGAVFSLLTGALLGTLVGIPLMMIKKKGAGYSIPLGPFLSLGALFFMTFGSFIIYGFQRLISGAPL
jgi:leader peptidase (prepilin peptidase) / N-methyltransferase